MWSTEEGASLNRRIRVRAGHRASATRAMGRADEMMNLSEPLDTDILTQLKVTLDDKLIVLKDLDAEILDMVEEDNLTNEIEQADDFKGSIYAILVKMERVLKVSAEPEPKRIGNSSHSDSTSFAHGECHVKLPKLSIQPFGGDLTFWTPFWESYRTAIHDNPKLTDTEKFNYLRSFLVGNALDAISGLSLTAPNYTEAVFILEKRFGNKQRIVAKHMDALMNIEAVTSQHNLRALRRLYDNVESHTRSLKSLGVESGTYGSLLASVLINKLPQELQLLVSRRIGEEKWELDEMLEVIGEELQARERTKAMTAPTAPVVKKPGRELPTAAALLTRSGNGPSNGPSCSYCQQPHSSNSCHVATHPDARRQILQKAGRCFICLRRGLISRECHSNAKCFKCGGRHHVSICSKGSIPTTKGSTRTNSSESRMNLSSSGSNSASSRVESSERQSTLHASSLNAGAPAFESTSSTSLWVSSDRAVLLQTAQAQVFNLEAPQHCKQVRIVLDCGSQHSYISDRVAGDLSLRQQGEQSMTIMTFGSKEEQSQICTLTKIGLVLHDGQKRPLKLYCVPFICQPLTCQPISFCRENFEHLSGLELADPSDDSSRLDVDILIGSDQYWELVTGEICRGSHGPIAINTQLGWVLSGPVNSPSLDASTSLITHTLRVDGLPQNCQRLDDQLKSFWELESFGISNTEHTVYDEFQNSVRLWMAGMRWNYLGKKYIQLYQTTTVFV